MVFCLIELWIIILFVIKLCRLGIVKLKIFVFLWGIILIILFYFILILVDFFYLLDLIIDFKILLYFGLKLFWDKEELVYNIEYLSIFWFKIVREFLILRVFNCF